VQTETQNSSFPALKVENISGVDSTENLAAVFEGQVVVDGNISAEKLLLTECHWEDLVQAEIVCPDNGFITGYEDNDPGEKDRIYCCGNP